MESTSIFHFPHSLCQSTNAILQNLQPLDLYIWSLTNSLVRYLLSHHLRILYSDHPTLIVSTSNQTPTSPSFYNVRDMFICLSDLDLWDFYITNQFHYTRPIIYLRTCQGSSPSSYKLSLIICFVNVDCSQHKVSKH